MTDFDEPSSEPYGWQCPHCRTHWTGTAGPGEHWCRARGEWYQTRLAEALEAKGIWFHTAASPAPGPDEYRSGPVVSEVDLTRLADEWLHIIDNRDTYSVALMSGYRYAACTLLGITSDDFPQWVQDHRTPDGDR